MPGRYTSVRTAGITPNGCCKSSVREWSLIVPLAVVLALVGFVRERHPAWLAPVAFLGLGYLLFTWVTWADPEGAFRLVASAYRYVTPPIVLAGIFLPVLGERLARSPARQRRGRARAPASRTAPPRDAAR